MRVVPLLAVLAFAMPATAQEAPAAKAGAQEAKPEKMICRRFATTGSIMGGKRVCHTKSEWSRIDGVNAREQRDSQRELGGNNRMPVDKTL